MKMKILPGSIFLQTQEEMFFGFPHSLTQTNEVFFFFWLSLGEAAQAAARMLEAINNNNYNAGPLYNNICIACQYLNKQ